jgi:hypothetical protein
VRIAIDLPDRPMIGKAQLAPRANAALFASEASPVPGREPGAYTLEQDRAQAALGAGEILREIENAALHDRRDRVVAVFREQSLFAVRRDPRPHESLFTGSADLPDPKADAINLEHEDELFAQDLGRGGGDHVGAGRRGPCMNPSLVRLSAQASSIGSPPGVWVDRTPVIARNPLVPAFKATLAITNPGSASAMPRVRYWLPLLRRHGTSKAVASQVGRSAGVA